LGAKPCGTEIIFHAARRDDLKNQADVPTHSKWQVGVTFSRARAQRGIAKAELRATWFRLCCHFGSCRPNGHAVALSTPLTDDWAAVLIASPKAEAKGVITKRDGLMLKCLGVTLFLALSLTGASAFDLNELAPCKPAAARFCDRGAGMTTANLFRCGATLAAVSHVIGSGCRAVLRRYGQLPDSEQGVGAMSASLR
jgi:hypothetical protein